MEADAHGRPANRMCVLGCLAIATLLVKAKPYTSIHEWGGWMTAVITDKSNTAGVKGRWAYLGSSARLTLVTEKHLDCLSDKERDDDARPARSFPRPVATGAAPSQAKGLFLGLATRERSTAAEWNSRAPRRWHGGGERMAADRARGPAILCSIVGRDSCTHTAPHLSWVPTTASASPGGRGGF